MHNFDGTGFETQDKSSHRLIKLSVPYLDAMQSKKLHKQKWHMETSKSEKKSKAYK